MSLYKSRIDSGTRCSNPRRASENQTTRVFYRVYQKKGGRSSVGWSVCLIPATFIPSKSTVLTDSDINGTTARPTVWSQVVTVCHLVGKEHVAQMPTWRLAERRGKRWVTKAEIWLYFPLPARDATIMTVNKYRSAQCRFMLASRLFFFIYIYILIYDNRWGR